MKKKMIVLGIISIFLLASVTTQAALLSNETTIKEKDDQSGYPMGQQSDSKVSVYMGFVAMFPFYKYFYGNPQDNLLINVGDGATVVVYVNYYFCSVEGAKIAIRFDDGSDFAEVVEPEGEYFGTLEIEKYCEPDEEFSITITSYNFDENEHRTYKAYGKTNYYNTDKVSISAGFAVIKGGNWHFADPGVVLYADNNYDVLVGKGTNIDVTLDFCIRCSGVWDWGRVGFGFKGEDMEYISSSGNEYGRLTASKYFNQDETFELEINGKMEDLFAGNYEDTISSFGSTKPYSEDLKCSGDLKWSKVKPGSTVIGSLIIENIGDICSELDWEIESWPTDWGIWTFSSQKGDDLKPEDDSITVDVTIEAPDDRDKFGGIVVVINRNNHDDVCEIPVSLSTSRNRAVDNLFMKLLEQFPLLQRLLNL